MTINEIMDILNGILRTTGVFNFQFKFIVMWVVGFLFMYLAIAKKYEPILLLPIGFGIFIVNFPLVPLIQPGIMRLFTNDGERKIRMAFHYNLQRG